MTDKVDYSQVKSMISVTKIKFMLEQPFFACLLAAMDFEITEQFSTGATDGKKMYLNPDFFKGLTGDEQVFLFAHEILHCAFSHFTRKSDRDHQYWNMAADYAINDILVKDKIGTLIKGALHDKKYEGWTAERIYDDLMKNNAQKMDSLDQHIYADSQNSSSGKSDGDKSTVTVKELNEKKGSAEEVTAQDIEDNMEGFKERLVYAAQQAKMAGKLSAGIESLIDDLLKPKIDWRQILRKTIQSLFKSDTSWAAPRRRLLDRRCVLPTYKYDETVDICVSIDTSGSITEEMKREFLSEIYGIVKYYKNFKMKIWCFDTEVQGVQEYDFTNAHKIKEYKMVGGGGTDVAVNFEFMKENKIKPKQFICFTDGYTHQWGDPLHCPTTWLIHSNNNLNAPFGRVVEYILD